MAEFGNIAGGRRLSSGTVDYVTFSLTGLEEAKLKFKTVRARVRASLRLLASGYGNIIRRRARLLAPVDTGVLRRKITKRMARKAPRARVLQTVYYGSFVELGTVKQRAREHLRRSARPLRAPFRRAAAATIKASLRSESV